jgi:hypothetical protein
MELLVTERIAGLIVEVLGARGLAPSPYIRDFADDIRRISGEIVALTEDIAGAITEEDDGGLSAL